MGKKGIGEPAGRVLVLPGNGFEHDLVAAAESEDLRDLLERLFVREPFQLDSHDRKLLAREVFELDITKPGMLDNLQWLDTFVSFVLDGEAPLKLRALG